MGKEFESQEDWQEDEAVSGQYFDKPKPDIGIKRISLNLPPNKELIETAIRRLGQKIQTKNSKLLKEHLVDGYIEKRKKDILDDALLNAYENYLNAVFIDPSLVMGKLGYKEAKVTSPMDIETIRLIDDKIRKEFKELHGDKAFVLPLDKLSTEKQ
ncbi:MAG: hypothetical protein HY096_10770 [Nitrospinae bacterium]|nr:hypothetical protein [Nitrospinota bacterium]